MRARRAAAIAWLVCLASFVAAPSMGEPRMFSWFGELVALEGTTATLRVQLREPVLQYVTTYGSGDRVTLVWSASGDAVVYAPPAGDMKSVPIGFVVDAELVSADAASKTALVKVPLPSPALTGAGGMTGRWIKVTMAASRAAAGGPVTVVTAERPQAPLKGQASATAAANGSLTGSWTLIATRRSGVSLGADCTLKEEGGRVTGSCVTPRYGETAVTGTIANAQVTLRYESRIQNDTYEWVGVLDATGTSMKGTVRVSDETVEFSAVR